MYNGQLPFIIKSHPDVRKAIEDRKKAHEIVATFDDRLSYVGSMGVLWGYIGGILCLIISVGLIFVMGAKPLTFCHIFALCGVWYFVFTIPLFRYLQGKLNPYFFSQIATRSINMVNHPP